MTIDTLHNRLLSSIVPPERFPSPFDAVPHPLAVEAADVLMKKVRRYMADCPESELHRRGKMFGVLVCEHEGQLGFLSAFSAMLDGSYDHPGFVPPVYRPLDGQPVGRDRQDSRNKQQDFFSHFTMLNALGETKNLLEIFRDQPPIWSIEDYFSPAKKSTSLPPSGAGECCAPKLLQAAYVNGCKPLCMAEFWMGASPKDELRIEGCFYPACTGKCRPILSHVLRGLDVKESAQVMSDKSLAKKTTILYEDDYLLVVNKPAGLLSVPGKGEQYSLLEYLSDKMTYLQSPLYPAHRLDQDTSGLLVVAKNVTVYLQLQRFFLRRDIHKKYLAELEQDLTLSPGTEGDISLPMLPNPLDRPRQMVNWEHGKVAITHYRVSELRGPHGGRMVELYPQTGRTHQLRVHCAHPDGLAVPIYGDRLYGHSNGERLMLHASELDFLHPVTGKMMHFCAPFDGF